MIELNNVSISYGKKQILNDVSFTIKKGEVTALIGENGSGKTTLINTICQLMPNYTGQITLDGKEINHNDLARVSYVPDSLSLPQGLTITQALDWLEVYYPNYDQKHAYKLLDFFKLKNDQRIGELSRGNKAKFNMLFALAISGDYIIMDEPFSGIDVFTREEIAEVFTTQLTGDQGVLISTHEIREIEFIVDRVILLNHQTVVLDFYPEEVREQTNKGVVDVMREVYQDGKIPEFANR